MRPKYSLYQIRVKLHLISRCNPPPAIKCKQARAGQDQMTLRGGEGGEEGSGEGGDERRGEERRREERKRGRREGSGERRGG
eukprot:2253795-Rhodomonas_salina.1